MWNWLRQWYANEATDVIPLIGPLLEQREPPSKTPNKQRFPFLRGKVVFAMKLPATHYVEVSFLWKDKRSNPALIEPGSGRFMVSNSELLAIKAESHKEEAGGTISKCQLWAVGPIGTVDVSLEGDADLGEGRKMQRFDGQLQIVGGSATSGTLTFSDPIEQPDETPAAPSTPTGDAPPTP